VEYTLQAEVLDYFLVALCSGGYFIFAGWQDMWSIMHLATLSCREAGRFGAFEGGGGDLTRLLVSVW